MKYKEAKKIVIKDFEIDKTILGFGWKFRWYPSLRKQLKQWAKEILEDED